MQALMETLLPILVIVGFLGVSALIFWLYRHIESLKTPPIDPQALLLLQQALNNLSVDLKGSMTETARQQQSSTMHMTNTVRDVTERLVKLEETNRQILGFSSQLDNLQRILTNPKQRGVLGEYYLETLLKNIFSPEQYQMQYKFKDGEVVDAAIFIKDLIIPVDSKFSLENYNRLVEEEAGEERARLEKLLVNDLKQRIVETSKYIRPQERTMDFAFMFIPHEAIYYDLLTNRIGGSVSDGEHLLQRAASKYRVVIVSPTSFSAYLQTVLQGLNALKIEEQTKEIRLRIVDLGRHLQAYDQYFQAVGKHLGTTVNQYNLATKEFTKIDKDILKVTGSSLQLESTVIDRPENNP